MRFRYRRRTTVARALRVIESGCPSVARLDVVTIVMTMVKSSQPTPYPVGNFKAHCLRLMEKVARTGSPILVTKRGKPLVRVVPAGEVAWDEATWRERGQATTVLPKNDDDLVRPIGVKWKAEP
jgi:prevent-host-death family protein